MIKKHKTMNRILALLLSLSMVLAVAPVTVMADENSSDASAAAVTLSADSADIVLAGEGTESSPYLVDSLEKLEKIRADVEGGNPYKDKYIKLTSDISLPLNWIPIGTTASGNTRFQGIIDGGNHTVTVAKGGKCLLGATVRATVKNLNIYGEEINGYGLVENYTTGMSVPCITIDNVTLKSGSKTKMSGFIGGYASGSHTIVIRNSKIEDNVTIGYTKDQSNIGAFAGELNGTMENCVSEADVYGVDFVGGLVGNKGQTMGDFKIYNSEFKGTVKATGKYVGGISGAGYGGTMWGFETAANSPWPVIEGCISSGTISGKTNVGGILGGDETVQCWDNGIGSIKNNVVTGKVSATGKNAGAVIGYLKGINKYTEIANNTYAAGSGLPPVGKVEYVDTSCTDHETASSTKYVNSATGADKSLPAGFAKRDHNRTDDPLGKDVEKLFKEVKAEKKISSLKVTDSSFKTEYTEGEDIDLTGIKLEAGYSDGSVENIGKDDVVVTGFNKDNIGEQVVTLTYKGVSTTVNVVVNAKPVVKDEVTVTVSILGDTKHGDKGTKHTLKDNNLTVWGAPASFKVAKNSFARVAIEKALEAIGGTYSNPSGNYIESITYNGVTLGEKDNGPASGWLYKVNGEYPNLGVGELKVKDNDVIVVHYSDDPAKDFGNINYEEAAAKVDALIEKIGKVTSESAAAIEEAEAAYEGLPEEAQKLVKNYDKLTAAKKAFAELQKPDNPEKPVDKIALYRKTFNETAGFYKGKNFTYGAEWPLIGLTRGGLAPSDKVLERYYQSVLDTLNKTNGNLSNSKYTEYSRVILGMTAAGFDPQNAGGYNLVSKLGNLDKVKAQGINGPVWALIALDSGNYGTATTRDALIKTILDAEIENGGWALSGTRPNVDVTAMAVQSLAPYYKSDKNVKAAVDRALAVLSEKQTATGSYRGDGGNETVESTAQVIVALTALGINPDTDARFIKNGNTVMDGLMGFYAGEGQFRHIKSGDKNGMATEQSLYALAAYLRFRDGKTSLYNMSDVVKKETPEKTDTVLPDAGAKGDATVSSDKSSVKVEVSEIKAVTGELTVKLEGNKTVKYDKKAMDSIKKQIPADAEKVEFVVEASKAGINAAQKKTIEGSNALEVFSIDLIVTKADGKTMKLHDFGDGKVQITVPFANPENKKLEVYRVEEDGNIKLMNSTYKNGMLSWVTDGHSYYMVTEAGKAVAAGAGKTAPKTGDNAAMIPWMLMLLTAASGVVVARKKNN